jgi:hypothetical protein
MQMQGTVLIHISTLLKYDAVLGSDWLKYLRGGGLTGSPFLLQVGGHGAGSVAGAKGMRA